MSDSDPSLPQHLPDTAPPPVQFSPSPSPSPSPSHDPTYPFPGSSPPFSDTARSEAGSPSTRAPSASDFRPGHGGGGGDDDARLVLYTPPSILGIFRSAAINLLLPFINGLMLGFGELVAHEVAFRFGWGGTRVCIYFPSWRRSRRSGRKKRDGGGWVV